MFIYVSFDMILDYFKQLVNNLVRLKPLWLDKYKIMQFGSI